MEDLGLYMRSKREEKGISLDTLAQLTKIRTSHLQAIERGDFHALPGSVYTRGFLMSYARCVGLDPDDIMERYKALGLENPVDQGSGGKRRKTHSRYRPNKRRKRHVAMEERVSFTRWVAVGILLLVMTWVIRSFLL